MTNPLAESSPSARARILAALYLFVVIAGISAQTLIADRLVIGDDAARTATNILANRSLYRLGYTIFMLEMVAQVGVSLMFYDLMKPVNRSLARASAVIGLTGCGIKTMARLFYYAPLILLGGASYLSAIEPAQLNALSLAFIKINNQGAAIGVIFFGFETLIRGWLVFKSEFLPRFLGVLSMIGGLGWLTFLWPPLGSQAFIGVAGGSSFVALTTPSGERARRRRRLRSGGKRGCRLSAPLGNGRRRGLAGDSDSRSAHSDSRSAPSDRCSPSSDCRSAHSDTSSSYTTPCARKTATVRLSKSRPSTRRPRSRARSWA